MKWTGLSPSQILLLFLSASKLCSVEWIQQLLSLDQDITPAGKFVQLNTLHFFQNKDMTWLLCDFGSTGRACLARLEPIACTRVAKGMSASQGKWLTK